MDAHCLVQADTANLTITYDVQYEAQAGQIMKKFEKEYDIEIKDSAE